MVDPSLTIERVPSEAREAVLPALTHLLQTVVATGASIGFLPPLDTKEAEAYWHGVFQDITRQTTILLLARIAEQIVGSVQLALATKPNALHRAEVQKLFVHPEQQGRGIGRALMQALEQVAREHKRSLLVLDTRLGDTAEQLYRKLGYQEAGIIPEFARSATGTLDSTIYFFKKL
uniref:N-acetyltransferase n=1 Tax=Thermosporothrix sp. COM3 TaxID=2490863 RepID=A0A455SIG0_9CHLR|nr:N-acetyltransferase [Thermosporothrix sp. COM3]